MGPPRKAQAASIALKHPGSSLQPRLPPLVGEIPSFTDFPTPSWRGGGMQDEEGGSSPHCSQELGAWRVGVPSHQHTHPSTLTSQGPGLSHILLGRKSRSPTIDPRSLCSPEPPSLPCGGKPVQKRRSFSHPQLPQSIFSLTTKLCLRKIYLKTGS